MKYPPIMAAFWILTLCAACTPSTPGDNTPPGCTGKCDGWGFDDRHELYEQPQALIERFARGVGALVDAGNLLHEPDGSATMAPWVPQLGPKKNICVDERFWEQRTLGYCTGFFAGNDIFVTAGHCIGYGADPQTMCASTKVLFDFAYQQKPANPATALQHFPAENVYSCKEVLFHIFEDPNLIGAFGADFAVLRLDRPVTGRSGLPFRQEGKIAPGERVFMIGHPQGLPMKVSTNGVVQPSFLTGQADDYGTTITDGGDGFYFDLEMFSGNSGGPIFNARTGEVEGVAHAYSGKNWVYEQERGCYAMGVCGVNVGCAYYPGAYPPTAYAARINAWVRGEQAPQRADGGAGGAVDAGVSAADSGYALDWGVPMADRGVTDR